MDNSIKIILIVIVVFMLFGCSCSCKKVEKFSNKGLNEICGMEFTDCTTTDNCVVWDGNNYEPAHKDCESNYCKCMEIKDLEKLLSDHNNENGSICECKEKTLESAASTSKYANGQTQHKNAIGPSELTGNNLNEKLKSFLDESYDKFKAGDVFQTRSNDLNDTYFDFEIKVINDRKLTYDYKTQNSYWKDNYISTLNVTGRYKGNKANSIGVIQSQGGHQWIAGSNTLNNLKFWGGLMIPYHDNEKYNKNSIYIFKGEKGIYNNINFGNKKYIEVPIIGIEPIKKKRM